MVDPVGLSVLHPRSAHNRLQSQKVTSEALLELLNSYPPSHLSYIILHRISGADLRFGFPMRSCSKFESFMESSRFASAVQGQAAFPGGEDVPGLCWIRLWSTFLPLCCVCCCFDAATSNGRPRPAYQPYADNPNNQIDAPVDHSSILGSISLSISDFRCANSNVASLSRRLDVGGHGAVGRAPENTFGSSRSSPRKYCNCFSSQVVFVVLAFRSQTSVQHTELWFSRGQT